MVSQFQLIHLTSLSQLRGAAPAWDDLWLRSDVNNPMARAELIAQWSEHFVPDAKFHALVVEQSGQWVAALPLVERDLLGVVSTGMTPVNQWTTGGEFLLDLQCDVERALDLLLKGVAQLPWKAVWLGDLRLDSRSSQGLQAGLARTGMPWSVCETHRAGWLEVDHNWNAYTARWSRTFRRNTLRLARRLAEAGEVSFETKCCFTPQELEAELQRGFEVEHRNWKGRAATSVLGSNRFPFFLRQAQQLAQWRHLHLTFLCCAGQPIAFVYGAYAKGVFHACKLGYDQQYAKYNPGHALYYLLFREFWRDADCQAVDFSGVFTEAQRHWRPTSYRVGRLVIGAQGLVGRLAVYGHEHWWPSIRRMRRLLTGKSRRSAAREEPQPASDLAQSSA